MQNRQYLGCLTLVETRDDSNKSSRGHWGSPQLTARMRSEAKMIQLIDNFERRPDSSPQPAAAAAAAAAAHLKPNVPHRHVLAVRRRTRHLRASTYSSLDSVLIHSG